MDRIRIRQTFKIRIRPYFGYRIRIRIRPPFKNRIRIRIPAFDSLLLRVNSWYLLDGNSESVAHVWSDLGYFIYLRHLFCLRAATNRFFSQKDLSPFMRAQDVLSYYLVLVTWINLRISCFFNLQSLPWALSHSVQTRVLIGGPVYLLCL